MILTIGGTIPTSLMLNFSKFARNGSSSNRLITTDTWPLLKAVVWATFVKVSSFFRVSFRKQDWPGTQAAWNIGSISIRLGWTGQLTSWNVEPSEITYHPRFLLMLVDKCMLSNEVIMRKNSSFRKTSSTTAEKSRSSSVLRSLLIIESHPILLSMLQQCFPWLKTSWDLLSKNVEDPDSWFGDSGLFGGCLGILEHFRFGNQELRFRGLDVVDELKLRVGRIRSSENPTRCDDPKKDYRIVDLTWISEMLSVISEGNIFTSLKEWMQTQSPSFKPAACKPATSLRIKDRAWDALIDLDGSFASI